MKKLVFRGLILMLVMLVIGCMGIHAMAEPDLNELYERFTTLVFDLDDVTADIQASFELDGRVFKEVSATQIQKGPNWYRDITLRTPMPDGTWNVSGYGILVDGDAETIVNYFRHEVAEQFYYQAKRGMISRSVGMNNNIALGASFVRELQRSVPEGVITMQDEKTVTVMLDASNAPQFLNPVLTFMLQYAGQQLRFIDYRTMSTSGWGDIADYETVTEGIFYCASQLQLQQASVRITLDDAGRIADLSGMVQLHIDTRSGAEHELKAEFAFAAHDYETSKLPAVEQVIGK